MSQLIGTALQGPRTRRLRAALSAIGIAIGIGAMVAVVGVSASAQATLLAEIYALGTNLLTVTPGQTFVGANEVLPDTSVPMIDHMEQVDSDAAVYQVPSANVYRSPLVPDAETGGIGVDAAGEDLPEVLGTSMASGHFLDAVGTATPRWCWRPGRQRPADQSGRRSRDGVSGQHLVFGRRDPRAGAARLVTRQRRVHLAARRRADVSDAAQPLRDLRAGQRRRRHSGLELLAATADPQQPDGVQVSRPSDALEARAAAKGQFTTLLLGLGAVALLVGTIGIANIMVICVLERRGEIGLRRALGATRRHIWAQFLAESAVLAVLGGIGGLLLGAGATAIYAQARNEPFVIPCTCLSPRPPPAS